MGRLLLLFVAVPAIELALLIELGSRFGTLYTIALIAITGVVGAALARSQGLSVLRTAQAETAAGRLPAESIADGVMILVAGALLVTPGVLTDAFGFLCLVPAFRRVVRRQMMKWFERAVSQDRVHVYSNLNPPGDPRNERVVFDVRDPRSDAIRKEGDERDPHE